MYDPDLLDLQKLEPKKSKKDAGWRGYNLTQRRMMTDNHLASQRGGRRCARLDCVGLKDNLIEVFPLGDNRFQWRKTPHVQS
jgi:hypothetical protein